MRFLHHRWPVHSEELSALDSGFWRLGFFYLLPMPSFGTPHVLDVHNIEDYNTSSTCAASIACSSGKVLCCTRHARRKCLCATLCHRHIYVYTHTYIHTYIDRQTDRQTHAHVHTYTHVQCAIACQSADTHAYYAHAHMHAAVHAYACTDGTDACGRHVHADVYT